MARKPAMPHTLPMTNATSSLSRPVAPVVFLGIQDGIPAMNGRPALPSIELWNIMPGYTVGIHPECSSISTETIHRCGYITPREAAREVQRRRQKLKDSHQPFSCAALR